MTDQNKQSVEAVAYIEPNPSIDECVEIVDGYGPYGFDVNEDYRIAIALKDEVVRLRYAYTGAREDLGIWKCRALEAEKQIAFPITAALMLEKAAELAYAKVYDITESQNDSGKVEDAIRKLIPTDAQACLDDYVRERCMEVAKEVRQDTSSHGYQLEEELAKTVNSVISEMRGK